MSANIRNIYSRPLLLTLVAALVGLLVAACGEDEDPTVVPLPTATPGAMAATPTATIYQGEDNGKVQIGFNLGVQGYAQQGAGVIAQTDRGMSIKITVLPAPGAIQQISIREGKCENLNDLTKFKWVATLDPAIGGVSETELPDRHISTVLDGNHAVAVSIPGGTFSQVATCGDLPDATALDIPETLSG